MEENNSLLYFLIPFALIVFFSSYVLFFAEKSNNSSNPPPKEEEGTESNKPVFPPVDTPTPIPLSPSDTNTIKELDKNYKEMLLLETYFMSKVSPDTKNYLQKKIKFRDSYDSLQKNYNEIVNKLNKNVEIKNLQTDFNNEIKSLIDLSNPTNISVNYTQLKTQTLSVIQKDKQIKLYLDTIINNLKDIQNSISTILPDAENLSKNISSIPNDPQLSLTFLKSFTETTAYKDSKNLLKKVGNLPKFSTQVSKLNLKLNDITDIINILDIVKQKKNITNVLLTMINNIKKIQEQVKVNITNNNNMLTQVQTQINNLNNLVADKGSLDTLIELKKYLSDIKSIL